MRALPERPEACWGMGFSSRSPQKREKSITFSFSCRIILLRLGCALAASERETPGQLATGGRIRSDAQNLPSTVDVQDITTFSSLGIAALALLSSFVFTRRSEKRADRAELQQTMENRFSEIRQDIRDNKQEMRDAMTDIRQDIRDNRKAIDNLAKSRH